MKITDRLRYSSFFSIAVLILMIPVLIWSVSDREKQENRHNLVTRLNVAFLERIFARDQYFLYHEKWANNAWFSKSNELGLLVLEAEKQLNDHASGQLVAMIKDSYSDTTAIFKRIITNNALAGKKDVSLDIINSNEERLVSQETLRDSELRETIFKLEELAGAKGIESHRRSLFITTFFVILVVVVTVINSIFVNRLLRKRLKFLHSGSEIIAAGNLQHRLEIEGSDELTDLAQIINKLSQKALDISEERYKNLFQNASIGIFHSTPEGKFLEVNPALAKKLGYASPEELVSSITDINAQLYVESGKRQPAIDFAKEHHGGWLHAENLYHRKDGSIMIGDLMLRSILNDEGRVAYLEGFVRDITDRKHFENALRESERRFRTVFEQAAVGVAEIETKSGKFVAANERYAEILGMSVDDMLATKIQSVTHPEDIEADLNNMKLLVDGTVDQYFMEKRYLKKDGSIIWVNLSVSPMWQPGEEPSHHIAIVEDITERKRAEENLRESETRLKQASTSGKVGLWDWNLITNKVFFSPEWKRQIGYENHEISDDYSEWQFRVHPEDLPQVLQKVRDHREGRSPKYEVEFRLRHKDDSYRWILAQGSIMLDAQGKQQRFLGSHVDITERKLAEKEKEKLQAHLQQAQKMEAIGTLAGGIAHDFNNILGAILGYSEMVQEDSPAGSMVGKDIEQVIKASHRAKDLVKQILAFSRQAETDHILLQPSVIIKEAIKMLRSSLPTTIDIQQNIDQKAGPILADPTQIHQVIVNLCTNAFHAMEESGGTLTISLQKKTLTQRDLGSEQQVQPGNFVELSVGDTGTGIAQEIQSKMFDPYFTTKEVGKGTGMGLAIIHGIAKSAKGFVSYNSKPGEGTVFHVYLPVIQDPAVLEIQPVPFELTQLGNERILFIDDEEILVEMGQAMLERLGYRVTVRRNSIEALNTFQYQPDQFDLVITDQTMPGMTGSDLARRMLQIRPGMPIILCTGYSSLITEQKARGLGIKGFAMKPLAKKDIAALIRKVLDDEKP